MAPKAFKAASSALAPVVMPISGPTTSRRRSVNSVLPSSPPQNVSADMPIMICDGSHVIASRKASGMVWRMASMKDMNISSEDRSGCSI